MYARIYACLRMLTYLIDLFRAVLDIGSGRSLRSKEVLSVPLLCSYQYHANPLHVHIHVHVYRCEWPGSMEWPFELRLLPRTPSDTYYDRVKTFLFACDFILNVGVSSASGQVSEETLHTFLNV